MAIEGRDECCVSVSWSRPAACAVAGRNSSPEPRNGNRGRARCGSSMAVAIVAHGLAGRTDTTGDAGVGHCLSQPDFRSKFIFRHHAVAVAHQMNQQGKHLRLQPDGPVTGHSSNRSGSSRKSPKTQAMRQNSVESKCSTQNLQKPIKQIPAKAAIVLNGRGIGPR